MDVNHFEGTWSDLSSHRNSISHCQPPNPETQLHEYSPNYYSSCYETNAIKSAASLSFAHMKSGGQEQLSPPLLSTNHQVENNNWTSPANHELAKPVSLMTTYDTNNNHNHPTTQWTEFTFVNSIAYNREHCSREGGEPITGSATGDVTTIGLPEFVNYYDYVQPSISSTASTLSSPTTSTDHNFNYQFDTFNSSLSNDEFETTYQQKIIDNYTGEASAMTPLHQEMSEWSVYQQQPHSQYSQEDTTQWTSDISHIPYEPNYYPFANGVEKLIF